MKMKQDLTAANIAIVLTKSQKKNELIYYVVTAVNVMNALINGPVAEGKTRC
jgi:hypothetical protein